MNGGSGSGPQYSAFPTGNSPNMGATTMYGMPQAGMTQANTYQMLQPGQYTPYQQPNWLSQAMWASNQPLQNANVNQYGRWGMPPGAGATNGYGMGASGWPSPQSLFGNVPQPPTGQVMPQGGPQTQPQGAGSGPGIQGAHPGVTSYAGGGGSVFANGQRYTPLAYKDALANQAAKAAAGNPQQVQQVGQQFGGWNPSQQAAFLQSNPRMAGAIQNAGFLTPDQINNLRGQSPYQSMSGQALNPAVASPWMPQQVNPLLRR